MALFNHDPTAAFKPDLELESLPKASFDLGPSLFGVAVDDEGVEDDEGVTVVVDGVVVVVMVGDVEVVIVLVSASWTDDDEAPSMASQSPYPPKQPTRYLLDPLQAPQISSTPQTSSKLTLPTFHPLNKLSTFSLTEEADSGVRFSTSTAFNLALNAFLLSALVIVPSDADGSKTG